MLYRLMPKYPFSLNPSWRTFSTMSNKLMPKYVQNFFNSNDTFSTMSNRLMPKPSVSVRTSTGSFSTMSNRLMPKPRKFIFGFSIYTVEFGSSRCSGVSKKQAFYIAFQPHVLKPWTLSSQEYPCTP